MNGKKIAIIIGIIFVCAAFAITIKIGIDRQERVQTSIKRQEELLEKAEVEQEKKRKLEIAALAPNGSPRSYIDDIRYSNAKQDNQPFRLAALGSSVTFGTGASDSKSTSWFPMLVKDLKKVDGYTSIFYSNDGYGGYTSGMLLKEGKVDELIKQKPNMVLFEICVLNDVGQSVPLDETLRNIENVVDLINKNLPDTKVVLLSPNPMLVEGKNNQNLTLADYVDGAKQLANKKGWDFIDIYEEIKQKKVDMKDYLSDGVHPNDKGYKLWFDLLIKEFEKKK
ncbi:SGNH/GDSL hydrolase family protein [Paenibacillus glycanilyticus]|uniref:SGNH/GDSL hydrolase family protein n=1 Tax=Paenibacillus glycanilyticus TaxID=126569 RepID=UPI00191062D2|nr:SGNH/GDSL hydrolase family protein [Paenibacillus glycanilyticus]